MKPLLFLLVTVPLILLLMSELYEPPEEMLTEQQRIERLLADVTFDKPKNMDILLNEQRVDNQTRETVKTLVLKTDQVYLPMSPRVPDQAATVLKLLRAELPEHDFGEPVSEEASYFQWLTSNAAWTVSSLETSNGHYSRWEKRTDVYQLTQ